MKYIVYVASLVMFCNIISTASLSKGTTQSHTHSITIDTIQSDVLKKINHQYNKGKNWLVVDFDGTCTEKDTTSMLYKLASIFLKEDDITRKHRQDTWKMHETEYFEEYNELKNNILQRMDSIENEINNDNEFNISLDEALDALDDISTLVTDKVSASKVLKGIPTSTNAMITLLKQQKKGNDDGILDALRIRSGCINAISRIMFKAWNFGVLSINWSRPLIDAVLLDPLREELQAQLTSLSLLSADGEACSQIVPLDDIIWNNMIDENGAVELSVPGAVTKRDYLKALRKLEPIGSSSLIVYIGDSATDLLGLIEADIGILVGKSQTAVNFAERWGIRLAPLSEKLSTSIRASSLSLDFENKTIWMTEDWNEINQLLNQIE